jgi:hypothetical protein
MRMGQGLSTIGLNNISYIVGSLYIYGLKAQGRVDTTAFLPNLISVNGTISVIDFGVATASAQSPPVPLFNSLPLQSVKYAQVVSIIATGLVDMTSFSGLLCTIGLQLNSNPALQSLAGLESLLFIDPGKLISTGPSLQIVANPFLDNPSKFRPLSLAAGCGGLPPPNAVQISIPACSNLITSYSQLCSYIGASVCP